MICVAALQSSGAVAPELLREQQRSHLVAGCVKQRGVEHVEQARVGNSTAQLMWLEHRGSGRVSWLCAVLAECMVERDGVIWKGESVGLWRGQMEEVRGKLE
jgi:hypothetical protein